MKKVETQKEEASKQQQNTRIVLTETQLYQAIKTELAKDIKTLSSSLLTIACPSFEKLVDGKMGQIAALLPYWLKDILPLSSETIFQLGVANLYTWWYYYIQDEILDKNIETSLLLVGHLALLKAVQIYQQIGVTTMSCWSEFHHLTRLCSEAHALELETRFYSLDELIPKRLAVIDLDFISNRAAPFYFNTIAQIHLAGVPNSEHHQNNLVAVLRNFVLIRQIQDDFADWQSDFKNGSLNYISTSLINRIYELKLVEKSSDLDLEFLVGYHIKDEIFWKTIEQITIELSSEALDILSFYENCHLQLLIENQGKENSKIWKKGADYRENCRNLFGIKQ